jgi:hypothetical protein
MLLFTGRAKVAGLFYLDTAGILLGDATPP